MTEQITKYWSQHAARIQAYIPGEQPVGQPYIKLNTNENPYGPGEGVRQALARFDIDSLRTYPDPNSRGLRQKLASYYGLDEEQIFLGNGSDEVLDFAFKAFFDPFSVTKNAVLAPSLTYSFYPIYAAANQIPFEAVPLNADLSIDIESMIRTDAQGLVLANPNAPTGLALTTDELEYLIQSLEARGQFIIVDEAYVDFAAQSALGLLAEYDNLLIVRTFSKSRALAGLRLGFALGRKENIRALEQVRDSINSYTVDRISEQLGMASLDDEAHFRQSVAKLVATRNRFCEAAKKLDFEIVDSEANFVLMRLGAGRAKDAYLYLRERAILVRHFDQPLIRKYIRITIGRDEEMDQLLDTLIQWKEAQDVRAKLQN